jgi:hypothetical protein
MTNVGGRRESRVFFIAVFRVSVQPATRVGVTCFFGLRASDGSGCVGVRPLLGLASDLRPWLSRSPKVL